MLIEETKVKLTTWGQILHFELRFAAHFSGRSQEP